MKRILMSIVAMLAVLAAHAQERIMVIGDSITGHAMNLSEGYKHQFVSALSAVGVSEEEVKLVPLGGSGQRTSTWPSILADARSSFTLDIPSVDVAAELNAGCDKLIVFLGMNDMIFHEVTADNPERFAENLQTLIDKIKERTTYKKLYLATPTFYGEEPETYCNKVMDTLAAVQIPQVAAANDAEVLDIRSSFRTWWRMGRMSGDGFRMTQDYIHPNGAGHFAIALAILRALGYTEAASNWETAKAAGFFGAAVGGAAGFSAYVRQTADVLTFKGFANADLASVEVRGWVPAQSVSGTEFEIAVPVKWYDSAYTFKLAAVFADGTTVVRSFRVGTPWQVKTGIDDYSAHDDYSYHHPVTGFHADAESAHYLAYDNELVSGKKFAEVFGDARPYWPNADHFGEGADSLDFTTMTASRRLEACYAMRRLYVSADKTVQMTISCKAQSGSQRIIAFLDGEEVFAASLGAGKSADAELVLTAGEHEFVIKAVQATNCFQASVAFSPLVGVDAATSGSGDAQPMLCTGGDQVDSFDGCNVHRFVKDGVLTVIKSGTAELLLVGGGGGGSGSGGCSGGGGAGGVLHLGSVQLSPGAYAVSIGAGGASGLNGGDTAFAGFVAIGGGAGGVKTVGAAGGSGGGGSGKASPNETATYAGGAATEGQGHPGGASLAGTPNAGLNRYAAGGGGGAGGRGGDSKPDTRVSGDGGPGLSFTQFNAQGAEEWFAAGGGGGGSYRKSVKAGAGGTGGGGAGAYSLSDSLDSGEAGTTPGSGGGGGSFIYRADMSPDWRDTPGGNGADGILIVKYQANAAHDSIQAEGGDEIIKQDGYVTHVFRNDGVFTANRLGELELLVVGGGGGGGTSGGGGAGGLVYSAKYVMTETEFAVHVGAGGAGAEIEGTKAFNGEDSRFGPVIAFGGGAGGCYSGQMTGAAGGSGGGGAGRVNDPRSYAGGTSVAGQGFAGGSGCAMKSSQSYSGGGGGGGAGGAGGSADEVAQKAGDGGLGRYIESFGSWGADGWFAGGGGGGIRYGNGMTGGYGHSGGGNGLSAPSGLSGDDAIDGTGSGGGGGSYSYVEVNGKKDWRFVAGGAGGSGIVIVRYKRQKPGFVIQVK